MTSLEYVGWKNACLPRLYYTQLDSTKCNAVAVTEQYAVTFKHGAQHSQLAVGSSVRLHSAAQSSDPFIGASDRPENIVTTRVVHINAFADLIILKAVDGDRFYEQDGETSWTDAFMQNGQINYGEVARVLVILEAPQQNNYVVNVAA